MVNIKKKEPRDPDKVQKIMDLRDIYRWRWREIAAQFKNMTPQAALLLYQRWKERGWSKGATNEPEAVRRTGT